MNSGLISQWEISLGENLFFFFVEDRWIYFTEEMLRLILLFQSKDSAQSTLVIEFFTILNVSLFDLYFFSMIFFQTSSRLEQTVFDVIKRFAKGDRKVNEKTW